MVRSGFWKDQLLKAAEKMCRYRMKSNKARVVLNGENIVMGRAKRGIFAGSHIQFGNQVSERGGNKTRRSWKPNVRLKRIYSFALDRFIKVHVTTRAMRCIDKVGGIDEYLVNKPDHKLENDLCLYWKREIQTVNRYLFKLQCGNVPPELHKQILGAYAARMATKRGVKPPESKPTDEETPATKEALKPAKIVKREDRVAEKEAASEDEAEAEEEGKTQPLTRSTVRANQAGGGGTLIYKKCASKHKYSKSKGFLKEWDLKPSVKFYKNSVRGG